MNSQRKAFERVFPVPEGVEWIDDRQGYRITSDDDYWFESAGQAEYREYQGTWRGWQAARAGSGESEPSGTEEAYRYAKNGDYGGNMLISCRLVVELVEALRGDTAASQERNQ